VGYRELLRVSQNHFFIVPRRYAVIEIIQFEHPPPLCPILAEL
jgi:hypothetical protein